MRRLRNIKRARLYDVVLLAFGVWLVVEVGRWVAVNVGQYTLRRETTNVSLPLSHGAHWPLDTAIASGRDLTVVLALSSDCQVCADSIPFYRNLVSYSEARTAGFGLSILVGPPVETDFVNSLNISRSKVKVVEANLGDHGVKQTPVLWVIDKEQNVFVTYVGRLSAVRQGNVIGLVQGRIPAAQYDRNAYDSLPYDLSSEELSNLAKATATQVVDVRSRELFSLQHRAGSLNIPVDELFVRAGEEMNATVLTVVDCTRVDGRVCDAAGLALGSRGFFRVHVLNRGATPASSCSTAPASGAR